MLHQWKSLAVLELADECATEQELINFLGEVAVEFEHLDQFADWVLKRRPY